MIDLLKEILNLKVLSLATLRYPHQKISKSILDSQNQDFYLLINPFKRSISKLANLNPPSPQNGTTSEGLKHIKELYAIDSFTKSKAHTKKIMTNLINLIWCSFTLYVFYLFCLFYFIADKRQEKKVREIKKSRFYTKTHERRTSCQMMKLVSHITAKQLYYISATSSNWKEKGAFVLNYVRN